MTQLRFELKVNGLDHNPFDVGDFVGHDTFSDHPFLGSTNVHGFRYDITLVSRDSTITADDVVDEYVTLEVYQNRELVKQVNGIARDFTIKDSGHNHTFYSLTLVPEFERLSLSQNSRIFQGLTVPEIITQVLSERVKEFAFALTAEFKPLEFCVQFCETDLQFIQRIAAQEGLSYYFEHGEGGNHTLVFVDNSLLLPKLDAPVMYNNISGGVAEQPYISTLSLRTQSAVNDVTLGDRTFKNNPTHHMVANVFAGNNDISYQRDDYHYFDSPSRFKDEEKGKAYAKIRLDFLRREARLAKGKSNEAKLSAGYRFTVSDHPNDELNREFVVVSAQHIGKQPQALEESGGAGATTYHNEFQAIPSEYTWRPTPKLKPKMDGKHTAIVVGAGDEEIYTNADECVRIQFFWDRYSPNDDSASCWIRVMSPWAGAGYGAMFIPRVGQEVVVDFLNGDPDQPIITGGLYHTLNKPPYELPANKTKTVLRTKSHGGKGYNELSFEDQAGQEEVFIRAQKDMRTNVLNDHELNVTNDHRTVIDNDQQLRVKRNQENVIDGELRELIEKDLTQTINGNAYIKVSDLLNLLSSNEITIEAPTINLTASSKICLQAGGSHLTIDSSGILGAGASVKMNQGGSAATPQRFSGTMLSLIDNNSVMPPAPPEMPISINPAALEAAEKLDVPMVKTCPLQES